MKKISFLIACSILFAGHTFGQSKKEKKAKYLPPQIQSDEPTKDMYDSNIVVESSSNCVECTEKLTRSYLTIQGVNKYGYVNGHGELVIPRIYDEGGYFSDGYAVVKIGNYYGAIDPHGSLIIPMKYSSLRRYEKTNFIATAGGFYGIIDIKGIELLPFIYDEIYTSNDNLVLTYQGKKGLYDFEQGKWAIPAKYKYITVHSEGHIVCIKENEKIDWYDKQTLTIIDSSYTAVDELSPGYFTVKKGDLCGVIDGKNNIIVPIIYQEFYNTYYSNNYLIAKKNDKYGIITYDNRVLIDFVYDNITPNNDLFIVQKNEHYGIIDKLTFKETTPCIYEEIRIYNNQRIFAKKNGLYGIIKYDGTIVEGFTYELKKAGYNSIYKKGNKYGLIDYEYNFITDAIYDDIKYIKDISHSNSYYLTIKGKEKILLDSRGIFFANVSAYDDVMINRDRGVIVTQHKKYGLIAKKTSEIIMPVQYDLIMFDNNDRCFVLDKGLYYEAVFDAENKPTLIPYK